MYWQSLSEWRNYHLTSSVDQATSLSPRAAVQWRSFLLICSAFKGIHTTLRGLLKAMIFVCYRQTKGGFFPFKWTNVLVCFIFRLVILSEHWFFFVTEDLYVQVSTFNHLLYNYWPCLFFHIVGWLLGMIVIIFSLLNLSPPSGFSVLSTWSTNVQNMGSQVAAAVSPSPPSMCRWSLAVCCVWPLLSPFWPLPSLCCTSLWESVAAALLSLCCDHTWMYRPSL